MRSPSLQGGEYVTRTDLTSAKHAADQVLWGYMDDGKAEPPNPFQNWIPTEVTQIAGAAAKAQGSGKWSADLVEDVNSKWWLLDMATAGNSYHDLDCQYAGLDKQDRL